MVVTDVNPTHRGDDGEFLDAHHFLSTEVCHAWSCGILDATSRLVLHKLFPGCRLMRMELPVAMPGKALFSAGNLAAEDGRPARVLSPLGSAAAGMALCERRWFHIAKSALPGLREYRDLCEAFSKHGCEGIVFVPILPQLPSWAVPPASNGTRHLPALPALGVLTLGVDSSTLVDARLLTSLFLLAHLIAQHFMVGEGHKIVMSMRGLSMSEISECAPLKGPVSSSASEQTLTGEEGELQHLQAGCSQSGSLSEGTAMSRLPSAESGIQLQTV